MRHKLRGIEVDMFVTNRLDWGHFVESHNFSISHLHNKLYEIINNCDCEWCDWEKRYLHENYTQSLDLSQPGAMCNAVPRYAIYRWHTARLWRSPTCRHMPPTIVLYLLVVCSPSGAVVLSLYLIVPGNTSFFCKHR